MISPELLGDVLDVVEEHADIAVAAEEGGNAAHADVAAGVGDIRNNNTEKVVGCVTTPLSS